MSRRPSDGSVIVIGAGIIGIACAHYLARAGRQVTVLDQGTIAGACSHGNCGHIIPSHVLPLNTPAALKTGILSLFNPAAPFRVKPQLRPSFNYWMMQFARRCTRGHMLQSAAHLKSILDSSFKEFEKLFGEGALDCDWRKSGLLYAFKSKRSFDEFAKTDTMLTRHFGVTAARIEGDALAVFDPALKPDLAGGFFYEQDALTRPDQLASAWVRQIREDGVEFVEHCEVQTLEKESGKIKNVTTSKGVYSADGIVLAAGAFSGAFAKELECSIPILPGKGYSLTVPRPEQCPRTSVIMPERNVAITPFSNGLRFGSMMEFVGFDDSIPKARMRQLKESGMAFLCAPPADGDKEEWFGWRPMTWDSLPIIGRAPKLKNVLIATGHGMLGLMLAPATGRLIAEMLEDRPRHIPDAPFSPARFNNKLI